MMLCIVVAFLTRTTRARSRMNLPVRANPSLSIEASDHPSPTRPQRTRHPHGSFIPAHHPLRFFFLYIYFIFSLLLFSIIFHFFCFYIYNTYISFYYYSELSSYLLSLYSSTFCFLSLFLFFYYYIIIIPFCCIFIPNFLCFHFRTHIIVDR